MQKTLALLGLLTLLAGPFGLGALQHHTLHAEADAAAHADCGDAPEAPAGGHPVDPEPGSGTGCFLCSALANAPLALTEAPHLATAEELGRADAPEPARAVPAPPAPAPQGRGPPLSS